MNNGAFGENFPYSNFHDLNMDWIIKIAKDFLDQYTHIQDVISNGEIALENKATELEEQLQAWYDEHSEDIANQLNTALDDLDAWYSAHSSDIANLLTTAIQDFDQHADNKLDQTLESIPDDYTELSQKVAVNSFAKNVLGLMALQNQQNILEQSSAYTTVKLPCLFINGVRRNRTINQIPNPATNTLASQIMYYPNAKLDIIVPTGYSALVGYYNPDGTYKEYQPAGGYTSGCFHVDVPEDYFFIEVRKTDNTDILPEDMNNNLDVTLTFANNLAFTNSIDKADRNKLDIWGLRKNMPSKLTRVELPNLAFLSGSGFSLFTDGFNYYTPTDLSQMKNANGNTYSVSNMDELNYRLNNYNSGDTIILNGGVYSRFPVQKSVNIIGYDAIVTDYVLGSFELTLTPNVYRTGLLTSDIPTLNRVLDASRIDEGILLPLTNAVNSSGLSKEGTYYWNGSTLYVHLYDNSVASNKNVLIIKANPYPLLDFANQNMNSRLYIEGVKFVGGSDVIHCANSANYTSQILIAKDCKFYGAYSSNCVTMEGTHGYFQNCDASYSFTKDGFNYHALNGIAACGLEIDCIAHDNGLESAEQEPSCNGSTVHDGGSAIRVGGSYYRNNGANVADISNNTVTYNYNCLAFDSLSNYALNSADFWTNYTAVMYVYACRAIGTAHKSLLNRSGIMYVQNTEYDTESNITPI